MKEVEVLKDFLQISPYSSTPVLQRFAELPGAIVQEGEGNSQERFVYVPGTRRDRVVLVAHADTVWHGHHKDPHHQVVAENGLFRSASDNTGLGADDRAGCAILWLFRESGHSLLVTDGEERHQIGSRFLMEECPEIAEELNATHQFMVQFDRRNARDFKCYDVGTDAFRHYVHSVTGYTEPDKSAYTDITVLCRDICGVNLSVGYYDEHSKDECIYVDEWVHTLNLARKWLLDENLPRFPRPELGESTP